MEKAFDNGISVYHNILYNHPSDITGECLSLLFVYEGCAAITANGYSYALKKSTAALIPPGTEYMLTSQPIEYAIIQISSGCVNDYYTFITNEQLNCDKISIVTVNANIWEEKIKEIIEAANKQEIYWQHECRCYAGLLLINFYRNNAVYSDEEFCFSQDIAAKILSSLSEILTVSDVIKNYPLHSDSITRVFKKNVGVSIMDFIQIKRIEKVRYLLINSDDSIKTISHAVGISDQNYLSRLFYKYNGLSPSEYRNNNV